MLWTIALIIVTTSAFILFSCSSWYRRPRNFPPGPWGFPLLGHLPRLGLEPHRVAAAWKVKYGPILGIRFASLPTVIFSDYKLLKDVYGNPAFAGRPELSTFKPRSGGRVEGFAFSSGRTWREQRTFVERSFKRLGLGSKPMELSIVNQATELVARLWGEAKARRPVDTRHMFNIAFWNVLWSIIAGHPHSQDDPLMSTFTSKCVNAISDVNAFAMLSMFMPSWWTKYLPYWLTGADKLNLMFKDAGMVLQPFIDQHLANHVPGAEPRDFIDMFLNEVHVTVDSDSSFHSSRSEQSLMGTLLDLFIGGIDTAASALSWLCLLLATHPNVQDRLFAELQRRCPHGNGRLPSPSDRTSFPYLEAVLHETMRFRTLVPLGPFRTTTEDMHNFHGFDIPKDTLVFCNIWEAHNDIKVWGDPQNFRPERWLSDDGSTFIRQVGFFAFSGGKRVCIGERLARDELFLFTAIIFQAFEIVPDPTKPAPSLEPKLGGTLAHPQPHHLIFIPRQAHDENDGK